MSELLEQIRRLQGKLEPLLAQHRISLITRALSELAALGVKAAVLAVGASNAPRLRDGALDFYAICSPATAAQARLLLERLSDETTFLFWMADHVTLDEIDRAFNDAHFEWEPLAGTVVVVEHVAARSRQVPAERRAALPRTSGAATRMVDVIIDADRILLKRLEQFSHTTGYARLLATIEEQSGVEDEVWLAHWLIRPAFGLGGMPIDIVREPGGVDLLVEQLGRIVNCNGA